MTRSHLDLSLLPRLSRQARESLYRAGITNLHDMVALTVEELQRIKGIKKTAFAHHASARAYVEDRPIWMNPLPDVLHQGGWMFDLETAALAGGDGMPWSLGWSDEQGISYIALVAPGKPRGEISLLGFAKLILVADKDEAWHVFHQSVGNDEKPIYHWTGFDAGVMRATAPLEVRQALLERMHDLHHTFISSVRLPIKSYSIKKVAPYFGFNWSGYEEWWAAETDYRRWLATDNADLIFRSCGYQRDDVLALAVIWDWLVKNAE
ncbi:MAG: ribonuclease H-like domain-containing protein [Anaerolineae bacterium]